MNVLKLDDLYNVQVSQFMFKMNYQVLPYPLLNVIKRNEDKHQYGTCQKEDFIIPHYTKDVVHRSFLSTGP